MPEDENVITTLKSSISERLTTMNILPQEQINNWLQKERKVTTLQKISDNLPTKQEFEAWSHLDHTLESLRILKHPQLCRWTDEEIIEALTPYLQKQVNKYKTIRCDQEDCTQNGIIGILNAIRTDAGIEPFAEHAYLHIQTAIRRRSATAGVISDPEKMPSKTEVRREIGIWLSGAWIEFRANQDADKRYGKPYQQLTQKEARQVVRRAERRCQKLSQRIPINLEGLVKSDDFEECLIQKTGFGSHAKEFLIKESFQLNRLDPAKVTDLQIYLEHKYAYSLRSLRRRKLDSKSKTVGDLIRSLAVAPNFHHNPISLCAPLSDDAEEQSLHIADKNAQQPEEALMKLEEEESYKQILDGAMKEVELSPEQEVVMHYRIGQRTSNDDGSEFANNFGKYIQQYYEQQIKQGVPGAEVKLEQIKSRLLSKLEDYQVSRQRITQFEGAIKYKMLDAIFNSLFLKQANAQHLLEEYVSFLERHERITLRCLLGIGTARMTPAVLLKNYEYLTGQTLSGDHKKDRLILKHVFYKSKAKLCRAVLWKK